MTWRMLVRNLTTKFGENAGKIWHTLEQAGYSDEDQLQETTKLSKKEFYAGVGWLARENKIKIENEHYKLDSTNLADTVGTTAGRVWKILDIWDEADLMTLTKLSDSSEEEVYAALGWLAREDKINQESGKYTLKSSD